MFPLFLLLLLPTASRPHEAHNGTTMELPCRPAELFVRTHMAPDFETPQLIRRLDWFHDDQLVASFEQSFTGDSSRQWWVAESGLELLRPFYVLRISPVVPEHAGTYKCRLETDPLFALSLSTATVNLSVLVRPVTPSKPDIRSVTNSSVTLLWSHPTAKAHRPILRYSIHVRSLGDASEFIIPAPSNATSVIVDNLSPHTAYAFSVRAENAAGTSDFSPERNQTTRGQAPSVPPDVERFEASSECVRLLLHPPAVKHGRLQGYHITLTPITNETDTKEQNVTISSPNDASSWSQVCDLSPYTGYTVTVEAMNEFGSSHPVKLLIQTEQGVPEAPPSVRLRPLIGQPIIAVHWKTPEVTRGVLTHFSIHFKPENASKEMKNKTRSAVLGEAHWKTEHLHITPKNARANSHRHELKRLESFTTYLVRVSASTVNGEGNSSATARATTDIPVPRATDVFNLSVDCSQPKLRVEWESSKEAFIYQLRLKNATAEFPYNTSQNHINLLGISYQEEYTINLFTLARSSLNSSVLLSSLPSKPHRFLLRDGCILQSSICTESTAHCQPLLAYSPSSRFIFLIVLSLLILFLFLTSTFALLLRQKCFHLKKLIKKKEKSVYLDELSPLVYDAPGFEEVPVELFYGVCEDMARDDNLKYRMLFDGSKKLSQVLQIKVNEMTELEVSEGGIAQEGDPARDRYQNVVATEATRIRIEEDEGSGYINANFIDSCEARHAYIATQAPLPHTFAHFWSMCWQERVNIIVVITNLVEDGRRKCDEYWPLQMGHPQQHGNYVVSLLSQTSNAYFIHRILSLRIAKSLPPTERRVHQVHFTGWPDHGVPSSVFPLLSFAHFVAQIHSTGPLLVHCSAGVGRSGSFILIDSMRRRLLKHRTLNMSGHLLHMRRQREKLVQTLDQFIFCHEAIRQLARHGITRVPLQLFPRYVQYLTEECSNGRTRLEQQYEDICKCKHEPRCSPLPQNPFFLPGFHRVEEFLVGHWGRECKAMWEAVWQNDCQGVLVIAEEVKADEFWTREEYSFDGVKVHQKDGHAILIGPQETLSVCLLRISPSQMDTSTWGELERVQTQRGPSHDSPMLIVCPATASLPPPSLIPPATHTLNTLMRRQKEMCSTGLSRPFVFCALTSLACQLEQHGAIDVVQTLSTYTSAHCGAFYDKHVVEYIYNRLLQLANMNKT